MCNYNDHCHRSSISSQCNIVRYRQGSTGSTGPTGTQGFDGPMGPTGSAGPIGASARTIFLTNVVTNGQTGRSTAPAGARFADITVIGGGGAGGHGIVKTVGNASAFIPGFGGGGAGGITVTKYPIMPGVPYSMISGIGGVASGANGTNSSFTIDGESFIATGGGNASDFNTNILGTPGIGGTGIKGDGFGIVNGIGATAQEFTGSNGISGGGGICGISNSSYGNGGPPESSPGQGGTTKVVFYA